MNTSFDLPLHGGHVIDPAAGADDLKDVAIRKGKVAAVQSDILPASAREVIYVTGEVVAGRLVQPVFRLRARARHDAAARSCRARWPPPLLHHAIDAAPAST